VTGEAEKPRAEQQAPQPEQTPPRRRRRVLALALVVLGAVIGGAGVVFIVPRPGPTPQGPPGPDVRLFDHPDPMEFTFNPTVERGHRQARISFLFTYKADSKDVGYSAAPGGAAPAAPAGDSGRLLPVPRAIKINWSRAYSRCLEVLSNQSAETLLDPDGKRRVKAVLIDELSATLFPDRIATVDDILWKGYFIQ
jgi:hypothetical protein